MPTFIFNKLVRSKLPKMYADMKQKIITRELSEKELRMALKKKLLEEAKEIPLEDGSREAIISELGDVVQVVDDLKQTMSISTEEIENARLNKLSKKGGFLDSVFIEQIELEDDDTWIEYYRAEPKKYPELSKTGHVDPDLPEIEKGTYNHTKSGQLYEVVGITFNTETNEPLVIYRPLYKNKYELFARPYDVFIEKVKINGELRPRFEKVD